MVETTFLLYMEKRELERIKKAAKTNKQSISSYIVLAAIDKANETLHHEEQKEMLKELAITKNGVKRNKRYTKWI